MSGRTNRAPRKAMTAEEIEREIARIGRRISRRPHSAGTGYIRALERDAARMSALSKRLEQLRTQEKV